MRLKPSNVCANKTSPPCSNLGCQAATSPTVGAPPSPVTWHKAQLRTHFCCAAAVSLAEGWESNTPWASCASQPINKNVQRTAAAVAKNARTKRTPGKRNWNWFQRFEVDTVGLLRNVRSHSKLSFSMPSFFLQTKFVSEILGKKNAAKSGVFIFLNESNLLTHSVLYANLVHSAESVMCVSVIT